MIRKKVCMLGSYAVGKTSLVMRYVKSIFSERYETTIGVRILKKELVAGSEALSLLLWDMHGDDDFQEVRTSYLRGASGYLVVADGTRAETSHKALELDRVAREYLGDVPSLFLLNKSDLEADWELDDQIASRLLAPGVGVRTSAKTGEGVETAFLELATRMIST